MRRKAAIGLALAVLLALIVAPAALASAGGGSAGFSGGGGGGGGGGHGFVVFVLFELLFRIAVWGHGLGALLLIALGLLYLFVTRVVPNMQARYATAAAARSGGHHRTSQRERHVQLAAAEAADEDPEFAPDVVIENATRIFLDVQKAWDAEDRIALRGLIAPGLLAEWERRLDDFDRRGWRNRVEPIGNPVIEYVGLTHHGDESDRVVVKIDARLKDYVVDRYGRHLKRSGRLGETTRIREFWTLGRRGPHWVLISIEQGAEGKHALDEQIVATPWADERAMHDEAMVEAAVADAVPEGTKVSEIAELQFEGDAHSAANDLSLADGRFAPDVLEIAARRAVQAWAEAVDGADTKLRKIATPAAAKELLYAGDPSGRTRLVVRGPVVNRIRIIGLDAGAEPPTMTVQVDLTGRRYLEDRDTTAVLAGSRSRASSFTERWVMTLDGDQSQPWRISSVAAPVGLP